MMNERHAPHPSVVETSPPIAPAPAGNDRGKGVAYDREDVVVPSVLPLYHFAISQVADVGWTRLNGGLDEHPSDMAVEQA